MMFVNIQNIADNFIRSPGAKAFASMLETNTTLKTLSLRGAALIEALFPAGGTRHDIMAFKYLTIICCGNVVG